VGPGKGVGRFSIILGVIILYISFPDIPWTLRKPVDSSQNQILNTCLYVGFVQERRFLCNFKGGIQLCGLGSPFKCGIYQCNRFAKRRYALVEGKYEFTVEIGEPTSTYHFWSPLQPCGPGSPKLPGIGALDFVYKHYVRGFSPGSPVSSHFLHSTNPYHHPSGLSQSCQKL